MPLHRRRHRWLAFVAIFGLLFQQLAMAGYACPLERDARATTAAQMNPPCHESGATDKARCHEHCHPLTTSSDHSSPPTLPPAILPPTTWQRAIARKGSSDAAPCHEVAARAAAPPITIRDCTFQI